MEYIQMAGYIGMVVTGFITFISLPKIVDTLVDIKTILENRK